MLSSTLQFFSQWALELVTHAQLLSPNCEITRRIKTNVLRILATTQSSAPGRNWYLTAAKESEEEGAVHDSPKWYNREILNGVMKWDSIGKYFSRSLNSTEKKSMKVADQLKLSQSQKNQVKLSREI